MNMFPSLNEIKLLREKIGWSQIELANKVGVSQSAITKYESGSQIPSYEIATKIFEFLLETDLELNPSVSDLMTTDIIIVNGNTKLGEALDLMKKHSISQIPVIENNFLVGSISETLILDLLNQYHDLQTLRDEIAQEIMGEPLPSIPISAKLNHITPLLRNYDAILINDKGKIIGIVTKADLLVLT